MRYTVKAYYDSCDDLQFGVYDTWKLKFAKRHLGEDEAWDKCVEMNGQCG